MELFCPFAVSWPGPAFKQGAGGQMVALKRGEVKHSAEGYLDGAHGVLANPGIQSSWHFTIAYDHIEQHYPLDAVTWHANDTDPDGMVRGNNALVGLEHLGVVGEPLTPYQVDATVRLTQWMAAQYNRTVYGRYPHQFQCWTMAEHNEIGNDATACPSYRIPWEKIMAELQAFPIWAYGDQHMGCELRGLQHIFWSNGVEVLAIGDPEAQGPGRIAKNFGGTWYWLRRGQARENGEYEAKWSNVEGD